VLGGEVNSNTINGLCETYKPKLQENITMIKLFVSTAIAIALLSGSAFAKSEIQVTRIVYDLSDFPELAAKTKAVCEGNAVKSVKLVAACKSESFPKITKAGKWYNVGIGAELNTLIANSGATAESK